MRIFYYLIFVPAVLLMMLLCGCNVDETDESFNSVPSDSSTEITADSQPITDSTESGETENDVSNIPAPELPMSLPEYPIIDGSSSTVTMHAAIKAYLTDEYIIDFNHSQTYAAIERLVPRNDSPADVVLAVKYYDDTLQELANRGADLVITPIAKEGFVFIVHKDNPIDSLTQQELRDIYSGKITNWKDVGGNDEEIIPFTRNADSGSQTAMEDFMGDDPSIEGMDPYSEMGSMGNMLIAVHDNGSAAIGYNIYSWSMEQGLGDMGLKTLAVDGTPPLLTTLADDSYPLLVYTYSYYNGGNEKGKALTDWLLTDEGQEVIASAGYVGISGELPTNEVIDFNKDINESFDVALEFYLSSGIKAAPSAVITGTQQVEELSYGKSKIVTVLWVVPLPDDSSMRFIVMTRDKGGDFEVINEGEVLAFDGENNIITPGESSINSMHE